ncbi:MAG: DUF1177 domain-containing protein [Bacillota bacterium]
MIAGSYKGQAAPTGAWPAFGVVGAASSRDAKPTKGIAARGRSVRGEEGSTDFVRLILVGSEGASRGGDAPTLGVVGRLGGVGARPAQIGLVSDADGAICALSVASKLLSMQKAGDILPGDVVVSTHVCPNAPVTPHDPVPFMGSPVSMAEMNSREITKDMRAVLSIDTTKGNGVVNRNGFAITPTVKQGYILPPAGDLLEIMAITTGRAPVVLPLAQQDITPYGNGLDHINSLVQPATATDRPVVGVAITAETVVPGCATGASREIDIASAGQFVIETAIRFTRGGCSFYSEEEYGRLVNLYGSMRHFQTRGE